MTPRSHPHAPADHCLDAGHTLTAATDSGDSPVVHWPEPSPLRSWWNTIMAPAQPPDATPRP
ncbi:hypothetical protein [Nocardia sp. CA-119907]|uniref:hypothetical protein n=1 Tax=Nocardia sp. CA-119907 TaxID=3239973 RepID=UPI003D96FDCE